MYDLATHALLFALPSAGVGDVKMSGRLLLAARAPKRGRLPLEVYSAENGQLLARHKLPVPQVGG